MLRSLLVLAAFALTSAPVLAQGDLDAERQSLSGAGAFAVSVTIEGPDQIASSEALDVQSITNGLVDHLRDAGLPAGSSSESGPVLSVHVNTMQLANGLVPFSIELGFLQDVELTRNDHRMAAETWNESVVGLVSHDMVPTIAESIQNLVDQFAQDFQAAQ